MSGTGVRALARDVFFYDLRDPSDLLGGLVLNHGVTNANFYAMIGIVLVISSIYSLQNDKGETLPQDSQPLLPGKYFVVTGGIVDMVVTRTESLSTGTRVQVFRDQVRERDGGCVITKDKNFGAPYGVWRGFEAAHIFPLAYEKYWNENGFGRRITLQPSQGGSINSVENGLLLRADILTFPFVPVLDLHLTTIQDDYKIVCFQPDSSKVAGGFLDRGFLHDPRRPAPELLRWHFQQAVLTNMRGTGEPVFEHDFPRGSDITGDIRDGPKAAERMEFELFSRLAIHEELGPEDTALRD
ncbi:hypothetical protein AAE478_005134 [Parahypoxylon ruwenzoriense]